MKIYIFPNFPLFLYFFYDLCFYAIIQKFSDIEMLANRIN